MAIGSMAPWTDHEKNVCSRLSATISSLVIAPGAVPMPMISSSALAGATPDYSTSARAGQPADPARQALGTSDRAAHRAGRVASSQPGGWWSPSVWIGWAGSASTRTVVDRSADDVVVRVVGPPQQVDRSAQPVDQVRDRRRQEVQPTIGRVERLARPEPARDEVAAVGDEHEQALDLERRRRRRRCGSAPDSSRDELADRRADVRPEAQPALPLVLGRGHDPGVEAHPDRDGEGPLVDDAVGPAPAGLAEVELTRLAGRDQRRGPARTPRMRSAPARTLPVPPGTMASGVSLPAMAVATSRTVPSPPATTTSGRSAGRLE